MSEHTTSGERVVDVESLRREFVLRRSTGRLRRERRVVTAVDDVTFSIDAGESVGYIGANGAGKSTTIKMLTGILVPTSGRVTTCGLDPVRRRRELARHVGVVFGQRSQLWWDLPLRESFRVLAAIHDIDGRRVAASARRAGRPARAGRVPRAARAPAEPRPAHARRGRGGAAAPPAAHRARRAHDRPRRAEQGAAAGLPARAARGARHDAAADHARHGRHRAALRARARRRPGPTRLRRQPARPGRARRGRARRSSSTSPSRGRRSTTCRARGSWAPRPTACASASPSHRRAPLPQRFWPR